MSEGAERGWLQNRPKWDRGRDEWEDKTSSTSIQIKFPRPLRRTTGVDRQLSVGSSGHSMFRGFSVKCKT